MQDLQLWQQLKAGEKNALAQIYEDHAAKLLKYGYKFADNEQLVEDCLQDLFVELWKNRAGLSDTDSIQRYLFVALRRKVIRQVDRIKKKIHSEEPQEYQFDVDLSIDDRLIAQETAEEQVQLLKKAVEGLSSRQKEVIYLKYYAEMDYQDISEVMDINYQSVRNLVFNALKSLKKQMTLWWLVLLQFLLNLF